MIICINCSQELKSKMDRLLKQGGYGDYSELFAVAVENLWVLDQELGSRGSLIVGGQTKTQHAKGLHEGTTQEPGNGVPTKGKRPTQPPARSVPIHIPELFSRSGLDALAAPSKALVPLPQEELDFPLDQWIFGQYNRLLPAKVNCRALLRVTAEQEQGASFATDAPRIAREAAVLGDYLAHLDQQNQSARDDALATAFPRSGEDTEKSCARYANHFIGGVNSQGVPWGLLCAYSLAVLSADTEAALCEASEQRIILTEQGLRLALLPNPVLDDSGKAPSRKFSPEETTFLLDHIKAFVPVEAFAFRTLLQAIAQGADNPEKLDGALCAYVPAVTNRSLSKSFLGSQRSGALSRMADLGLIVRQRKGVRVSYTVTPEGEAFLHRTNHKSGEDG